MTDWKMDFKHYVKSKAASPVRALNAIASLASTEKDLASQAVQQVFQSSIATIRDFGTEL